MLNYFLFIVESVGPFALKGLNVLFLVFSDSLDLGFMFFSKLFDGDFEFAFANTKLVELSLKFIDLFFELYIVIGKLVFFHHNFVDGLFESGILLLGCLKGCREFAVLFGLI